MSSWRAAPEIEPACAIASSKAILPGPMRSPVARSSRMDRRISGICLDRRGGSEAAHEVRAIVKERRDPPVFPVTIPASHGHHALYTAGYDEVVKMQNGGISGSGTIAISGISRKEM